MKTYTFEVVIEEDEWLDERIKDPVWRAYIPSFCLLYTSDAADE